MKVNRRELLRVVAIVAIAWVVLLLVLTKWQRSTRARQAAAEPELIHYPGTEDIEEQTSENLGFRKYWFHLDEAYPSLSVYHFYRNRLESSGWRPLTSGEPGWIRQSAKDKGYDICRAVWLSPDRLFQIEVEMKSEVDLLRRDGEVVDEDREPGIEVYITQRRSLHPAMMLQPTPREPRGGEIELPR